VTRPKKFKSLKVTRPKKRNMDQKQLLSLKQKLAVCANAKLPNPNQNLQRFEVTRPKKLESLELKLLTHSEVIKKVIRFPEFI